MAAKRTFFPKIRLNQNGNICCVISKRFEVLYHTSEHMRCMVWVGSAVVTPAQGPQAANTNTAKVAKYYVGEG